MSESVIIIILLVVILFSMSDNSSLREEIKKSNKNLDKISKHLGIVEVNENIDDELKEIISNGGKIKAIKRYREHTGVGLKESKEYIDNLDKK